MRILNRFTLLLIVLTISACGTTENIDRGYHFNPENKRPLTSDRTLQISLLNRTLPKDKLMMLAFTKSRANCCQQTSFASPQVSYISIKGGNNSHSNEQNIDERLLVENDLNSHHILGPSS